MTRAEELAREAWAAISLGNIARPANFEAVVKELTPFFDRARADGYRAGVEDSAKVVEDEAALYLGDDVRDTLAGAAAIIRDLAARTAKETK
jgi:hypothetical protein